ncbi:preprotein translocase subunit SecE [Jiulongibacter sediminis]|uniref:Protein translocase subunit SecE n=1 Tax=Jiulongibacter sediminis TaxID=1605367 RepID=A0A0P7BZS0_9BACT|nr:preprotein translocase subunit SecE [Jiulongibacter sediminis]KPM46617.1 preprotein translocase [Jiulongibacter sediminis]TBX21475.1 preprotein translocase [Jiulongibacter sediminis]
MDKLQKFIKESWHEITKEVTWPKFSELQSSATLVLVASVIFALVVGAIDFLIDNGLKLLYQSF